MTRIGVAFRLAAARPVQPRARAAADAGAALRWSSMLHALPVWFHRIFLALFNVRVVERGTPPSDAPTLVVSNHVSWLDIPVIGSLHPLSFIAKSEVEGWPVVGLFARLQRSRLHRPPAPQGNSRSERRPRSPAGEGRGDRALRGGHHERRQPAPALPLLPGRARPRPRSCTTASSGFFSSRSRSPIPAATDCPSPGASAPSSPGTATWIWSPPEAVHSRHPPRRGRDLGRADPLQRQPQAGDGLRRSRSAAGAEGGLSPIAFSTSSPALCR